MAAIGAAAEAAEQTLFVRKATGLVRGWSAFDGFVYGFYACNVILGLLTLTYATFVPGASLVWAMVITVVFVMLEVFVYAAMTSAIPRAGGDYVWQTRVFNGPVGFVLAATGWWFILWHWIPIYANLTVIAFCAPVLRILGADSAATWLAGKDGVFLSSVAVIAVTTAYVALGMRGYARIQRWTFYVGMAALVLAAFLLLFSSRGHFVSSFNREAGSLYGVKNAYAGVLKSGGASWPSPFSGSLGPTLQLVPFLLFWLLWPNWGATLAGEVRGARDLRKNVVAMSAALLLAAVVGFVFIAAISRSMGWDFFMASGATYWGGQGPIADWLSPIVMASWMVDSPVFQVLLITGSALLVFGWYGTVFLSSTRMIFAAAFDRVLPERAAAVSTRTGVPYVALALMAIPSVFVSALYAYWGSFASYTLDSTVVIAVTFLGTTLAAMVLPRRLERVYRGSPMARWRIGRVPLLTVAAALFAAFLIANLVLWLTDSVYGVNNSSSLIYMGVLYVIAIAIYAVAAAVRHRQGMGLEAVQREIPAE
jgi:basic amino acid/polyamine antiporter, APA family